MKSKVLLSILSCLALLVGLVGCSPNYAKNFEGSWAMESFDSPEQSISAGGMAFLGAFGYEIVLDLKSDGTAVFGYGDEVYEGTWEATSATEASLTVNSTVPIVLADERLTMEADGTKIVFKRTDKPIAPKADQSTAASASADTQSEEAATEPTAEESSAQEAVAEEDSAVQEAAESATEENSSDESSTSEEETAEIVAENAVPTLGSTVEFDDLSITFGDAIWTTTLDNQFATHNGETIIAVPVSVTNNKEETGGLNMFYGKEYGAKGVELDSVFTYFDDDIRMAGDARPGATIEATYYMLYDENGTYYITLSKPFGETVEIEIPVEL